MNDLDGITEDETYEDSFCSDEDSDSGESFLSEKSNTALEFQADESFYILENMSLSERVKNLDGNWESKSMYQPDLTFMKDSGPNVPEEATSPLSPVSELAPARNNILVRFFLQSYRKRVNYNISGGSQMKKWSKNYLNKFF